MKAGDLLTISPLIALTLTPVVVMLVAAIWRAHAPAFWITLCGLATTFGLLFVSASRTERVVTPLIDMDGYALFFIGLITVATAVVALLSWGYLPRLRVHPEEYYVLLLIGHAGQRVLVASTQFASLFLGIEILSVSLYALIVYPIHRPDGSRRRQVPRARRGHLRLPRLRHGARLRRVRDDDRRRRRRLTPASAAATSSSPSAS